VSVSVVPNFTLHNGTEEAVPCIQPLASVVLTMKVRRHASAKNFVYGHRDVQRRSHRPTNQQPKQLAEALTRRAIDPFAPSSLCGEPAFVAGCGGSRSRLVRAGATARGEQVSSSARSGFPTTRSSSFMASVAAGSSASSSDDAPVSSRYLHADPAQWAALVEADVTQCEDLFDLLITWYRTSQALHACTPLSYPFDPRQLEQDAASLDQPGRYWQILMHTHVQSTVDRFERACSDADDTCECRVPALIDLLSQWSHIWPLPPLVPVTPLDVAVANLRCHRHRRISPLGDFLPSQQHQKRTRQMVEDDTALKLQSQAPAVQSNNSAAPIHPILSPLSSPAPGSPQLSPSSPILDRHRCEADWLRQTGGRLTLEMVQHLGLPVHPHAALVGWPVYIGPLTLKQQVRFYQQLNAITTDSEALSWRERHPNVQGSRELPNRSCKRAKITIEATSSPDTNASEGSNYQEE
jgi:hypothetical protein